MKRLGTYFFALVFAVVIGSPSANLLCQPSVTNDRAVEGGGLEPARTTRQVPQKFNITIDPLTLVFSDFNDIEVGFDYKISRFATLGVGYRSRSGSDGGSLNSYDLDPGESLSSFRFQAEIYTRGEAFRDSYVVQIKYTANQIKAIDSWGDVVSASANGFGTLAGWRWFWTDPGQLGMNAGILGGLSRYAITEDGGSSRTGLIVYELRAEFGYAF